MPQQIAPSSLFPPFLHARQPQGASRLRAAGSPQSPWLRAGETLPSTLQSKYTSGLANAVAGLSVLGDGGGGGGLAVGGGGGGGDGGGSDGGGGGRLLGGGGGGLRATALDFCCCSCRCAAPAALAPSTSAGSSPASPVLARLCCSIPRLPPLLPSAPRLEPVAPASAGSPSTPTPGCWPSETTPPWGERLPWGVFMRYRLFASSAVLHRHFMHTALFGGRSGRRLARAGSWLHRGAAGPSDALTGR